jgi:hypothetical protein
MNRHERIRQQLDWLVTEGVITDWSAQGQMPGKRWHIIPCGYSERALTTSGIEDFILGACAALYRHNQ